MEWWSNGVIKGSIQIKSGLSSFPTLQYSSTPVLQKSSPPLPAKPLKYDPPQIEIFHVK
jgi:hypothetical protein